MTPHHKTTELRDALLERILDTVVSIDRNVQEILDRVGDHFDDVRYQAGWDNTKLGDNHDYE